jgi:hypothetical protein
VAGRDLVAVDIVGVSAAVFSRDDVPDDLMAAEIKVDPFLALTSDTTTEESDIELTCDLDVVDGEG